MSEESCNEAIGRLVRVKVFLKPKFHAVIDEIIDELVREVEKL